MSKLKIFVWNVNGIRAAERKGFVDWIESEPGDIVCVNETKAWPEQLSEKLLNPDGYNSYWTQAEKKGYSGVATYSKQEVTAETIHGFGDDYFDHDGRILITEYDNIVLFNIYFPNGKRGPEHVKRKIDFYEKFLEKAKEYEEDGKYVICVGDTNTAYQEIDLARPKENEKTSGFLPEERDVLGKFFDAGFIDSFRFIHPDTEKYSWWDMKTRARERNVGWRIDYIFVSGELKNAVVGAEIHDDVFGSDHCPISVELDLDRI